MTPLSSPPVEDHLAVERALRAWDEYPETQRQCIRRWALVLPVSLALMVGFRVGIKRLLGPGLHETLLGAASQVALQLAVYRVVTNSQSSMSSLRSELLRLDDVRLVPLWLASVRKRPKPDDRAALLLKLAKWLPRWHEAQTPLPESARRDLAREMARCCKPGQPTDPEIAFLTAALVALDPDPARGITPDDALRQRAAELARTDGRVAEAAIDALQRLGQPTVY